MGRHGERRRRQGGLAGTVDGATAQRIGSIREGHRAGARPVARRHGADGGGECHGLAGHGWIGGGSQGGRGAGGIDSLGQRRGGVVAGVEVTVVVIDRRDGMCADREGAGGEGGLAGAEVVGRQRRRSVFERDCVTAVAILNNLPVKVWG